MDPAEGTELIAVASLAAGKILGPAAGELGEWFRRWTRRRLENANRIFERVERRDQNPEGGSLPLRLFVRIVEDGSWISDPTVQEYYSGLLLGGRSPDGEDDSMLFWADVVGRMTVNQVRLHHAAYSAIATNTSSTGTFSGSSEILVATGSVSAALDDVPFTLGGRSVDDALIEAVVGLDHQSLVSSYSVGNTTAALDKPSLIISPSIAGCLLYLRAYGNTSVDVDAIRGFRPVAAFDPPGPTFTAANVGAANYLNVSAHRAGQT